MPKTYVYIWYIVYCERVELTNIAWTSQNLETLREIIL